MLLDDPLTLCRAFIAAFDRGDYAAMVPMSDASAVRVRMRQFVGETTSQASAPDDDMPRSDVRRQYPDAPDVAID
jgi:hypothetical protein